jgi:serine/threonine protein kinase
MSNDFKIIKEIGRGSFAVVYLASSTLPSSSPNQQATNTTSTIAVKVSNIVLINRQSRENYYPDVFKNQ